MAHLPPHIGKLAIGLFALGTIAVMGIACSTTPPESAVAPCWQRTGTSEPSANPPSFPYIFSGKASVDNQPAPDGLIVVACLGDAGTGAYSTTPTQAGMYADVLIGTSYDDEIGVAITFLLAERIDGDCLRRATGECLMANQTYEFNYTPEFNSVTLDLDFPALNSESGG